MKLFLFLMVGPFLMFGCLVKETNPRTFTPTYQAKAVGVSAAIERGAALLSASTDDEITVKFRPRVEGPYIVAVLPDDDRFSGADLMKSGIPESVVLEMEEVLFRFGSPESTICFHSEASKRKVSVTTSHRRYVSVPALLTAVKQGGDLAITLIKGEAGLIRLTAIE